MSNECDLEEAKHVALQKFLELAADPSKWKYSYYCDSLSIVTELYFGKFRACIFNGNEYNGPSYSISLGNESLFSKTEPAPPEQNYLSPAPWKVYTAEDAEAYAARVEAHKKSVEEVLTDPYVVAIRAISAYWNAIECEKQRQKILKDAQDACLRIQEALKEPTKKESEISKKIKKSWKTLLEDLLFSRDS